MSDTINPFESPRLTDDSLLQRPRFRTSRFAAAMTRIVVVPFGNVLGMLALFSMGSLFAASNLPPAVSDGFAALALIGIIAFDLWWRQVQPERAWWARLLSPYAGGSIAFIPIWLLFAAFGVLGVYLDLTQYA